MADGGEESGISPMSYNNGHHDMKRCETTRGADYMFHRYELDKALVLNLVYNEPEILVAKLWQPNGLLAIDSDCRCKMGKGDINTHHACSQCQTIRRLVDFRLEDREQPFLVECGHYTGRKLAIGNSHTLGPYLKWDKYAEHIYEVYTERYKLSLQCGTPRFDKFRAIEGDSFSIRTIIMWVIYDLFKKYNLPHCPKIYTAFVCGNNAYSMYDVPSIGSFKQVLQSYPVTGALIYSIILQLLVISHTLKQLHFSHGMPSINSMSFNKNPVSYMYDGVKIVGPITLQLADMWHSSAVINNVHYYSSDITSTIRAERSMYTPEIQTMNLPTAYCAAYNSNLSCPSTKVCDKIDTICTENSAVYYKLSGDNIDSYNAVRHMGFPIYSGSFDLYCWIVSMMLDNRVFTTVVNDPMLNSLWMSMWTKADMDTIHTRLAQIHEMQETMTNMEKRHLELEVISGVWLRCDIGDYLWSVVKSQ